MNLDLEDEDDNWIKKFWLILTNFYLFKISYKTYNQKLIYTINPI